MEIPQVLTISDHADMNEAHARWEFDANKDDWESYTERMDMYFTAYDIPRAKQTAMLLTKVAQEQLIKNLCAPAKPSSKNYEEIVSIMQNHLCPKPSETSERYKFNKAKQEPNESVAKFAARLKALAINYGFSDIDDRLKDQLVCGLTNHDAKTLLFCEENLTFQKAYKLAEMHEAAEKNAAITEENVVAENAEVNVVTTLKNKSKGYPRRSTKTYPAANLQGNNNYAQPGSSSARDTPPSKKCYCCGKPKHFARECWHRFKACTICHTRGHLDIMCKNKEKSKQGVHWQAEDTAEDTEEIAADDFLFMEPESITELRLVNSKNVKNINAEPMYLNVKVSGRPLDMR